MLLSASMRTFSGQNDAAVPDSVKSDRSRAPDVSYRSQVCGDLLHCFHSDFASGHRAFQPSARSDPAFRIKMQSRYRFGTRLCAINGRPLSDQVRNAAGPNGRKIFANSLLRPIPPFQPLQLGNRFLRKSLSDRFCRYAADDGVWRDILRYDGTRADDCAITNRNAG